MSLLKNQSVENFDKSLAEGVMLLTPFSATGDDEATVKFVKAYGDANNGETPNQFAADTYDVLYAMQAAANDAGITPDMSKFSTFRIPSIPSTPKIFMSRPRS